MWRSCLHAVWDSGAGRGQGTAQFPCRTSNKEQEPSQTKTFLKSLQEKIFEMIWGGWVLLTVCCCSSCIFECSGQRFAAMFCHTVPEVLEMGTASLLVWLWAQGGITYASPFSFHSSHCWMLSHWLKSCNITDSNQHQCQTWWQHHKPDRKAQAVSLQLLSEIWGSKENVVKASKQLAQCLGRSKIHFTRNGKGGNCPPLLHSNEAPPQVLLSALGAPAHEGYGPVGASPKEAIGITWGLQHISMIGDNVRELGLPRLGEASRETLQRPSKGGLQENWRGRLIITKCSESMRENGFKSSFNLRVVRHWHRLTREAVDAPSLEAELDGALSSLTCCLAALSTVGSWNWVGFNDPFNSDHSVALCLWS